MDLPREMRLAKEYVAKQVRCAYGTRQARSIWKDCYRDWLEGMGFLSVAASPCVFFHPGRNITMVLHGDDFNDLGVSDDFSWYEKQLKQRFEFEIRGCMGPGGNCDQIKILNEMLRLTPE